LEKIARFFNVTLDELVYMDGGLPQEVKIEDKTTIEQLFNSHRRKTLYDL
jgi:hypothetical protein